MLNRRCKLLLFSTVFCILCGTSHAQFLSSEDVTHLPSAAPNHQIEYGDHPRQIADLRLPDGQGPHPVAVIIHGGCWLSRIASFHNTSALSDALRRIGIATWNIEYRLVDNPGGGWPGTFLDVAHATDHLRVIAKIYTLDLERVIIIGHSSGGQLALWVAARHLIPKDNPLYIENPLKISGVIALGAATNLRSLESTDEEVCGDDVIAKLVGGLPDEVPERYQYASPIESLPIGVPQTVIIGAQDMPILVEDSKVYVANAKSKGDEAQLLIVEHASHHEVVAPGSAAWLTVRSAVLSMLSLDKK
ncbi:alpha/beta hydrolase family protein [Candidatus Zixiibacteriota bacterium]